jgi:regulator of sigma E protease
MSLGVAILGLAVLILVHEAGHFFVARAVGMTPRKFYLGFGPPLVKRTRGGVEYGIAAFPLGGYVKIPGMHRPAPGDLRKSLAPAMQRELEPQLDALDAALEREDEATALEVATGLEPQLGENRLLEELEWALAPDAYWRQKAWKKVVVIAAGPLTNVALAIVLFMALFMLGQLKATRTVELVLKGHPAAAAGLRPGDQILVVAGHKVDPLGISKAINGTHGRPFTIVVRRPTASRIIVLGPLRARLDQGIYRVGFAIKGVPGPGQSFPRAVWSSLRVVGAVTRETVRGVAGLVVGHGTRNVSSAVGIVRATSQAFQQSLQDFLGVIGLISLALALLNLLPVLPLDGGHILMSVLERIRGRAFSQLAYMRFSAVGLTLFALLLYIGLRNDFSGGHS